PLFIMIMDGSCLTNNHFGMMKSKCLIPSLIFQTSQRRCSTSTGLMKRRKTTLTRHCYAAIITLVFFYMIPHQKQQNLSKKKSNAASAIFILYLLLITLYLISIMDCFSCVIIYHYIFV